MASKKTSPKKPVTQPFTTQSSQAAYTHFLPLAKAVSTEGLDVCRADLEIARVNIERGVAAITPQLAKVKKQLPHCPIHDVLELPALILAVKFAAGKIAAQASTGEIDKRLSAMRPMREAALKQLEVFALLGLLPSGVPAAIRKGSGSLDAANDAIAIPGVFKDHHAAVDGKHPFTPAMLKKLGEDGDWLVKHLKPVGAKEAPSERDPASIVRDQLWSIVAARHEQLRQAGAVVFGVKDLDANVPPLGARTLGTSTDAKTDGAPAPAAPPTGTPGP